MKTLLQWGCILCAILLLAHLFPHHETPQEPCPCADQHLVQANKGHPLSISPAPILNTTVEPLKASVVDVVSDEAGLTDTIDYNSIAQEVESSVKSVTYWELPVENSQSPPARPKCASYDTRHHLRLED